MLVGRQKYGDEMKTENILRDAMRGTSVPPTANPLPTRFTSFPPTVPHPPVRLYMHLITCERAIHPLVFLALLIVDGRSDCPLRT